MTTTEKVLRDWRAECPALQKLWPKDDPVTSWTGLTFGDAPSERVLLKIHLPDMGLTSVPASIGTLASLGYVNLTDNKLRDVPSELCNISWLTYLNLERNLLGRVPHQLGELTRLKTLHLAGNPWQFRNALPSEWGWDSDLRQNGGCDFRR
jgi:leucine-rich repeat protein SHOC2